MPGSRKGSRNGSRSSEIVLSLGNNAGDTWGWKIDEEPHEELDEPDPGTTLQ